MTGEQKAPDEEFARLLALQEQIWSELEANDPEFKASDRLSREELYAERFDMPSRHSDSGSPADVPAQSD